MHGQPRDEIAGGANAPPAEPPIAKVDLGSFSRDLLNEIRRLHAEQGPIGVVEDGGQRVAFLFSPELNQQVLSDTERFHARFFAIRGPKRAAQRRLSGGLLSMNGAQHRRNRRMVKEPFGRRAIATYSRTVAQLTDQLLATWHAGQTLDVADQMRRYMLQVTSTILFGLDQPKLALRLGDMIARWVTLNDRLGHGALVPCEEFNQGYEELLAYAESLEAEVREMIRRRRKSPIQGKDVLSILVRTHDEEGGLTDEELVGQAAVLFSAAHMTTAHSLAWTLFLLAQHPSVMDRLWHEWQSRGEGNDAADAAWDDEDHDAGSRATGGEALPLLECVTKESMRLLPASAYSQRINVEAVQLGPHWLPRGTGIVFTPLVTHRLPDSFSEPNRFLPDRWKSIHPSPYAYHPFGAGARMCIGGPLALAIMRTALPRILTRFRLSMKPGAKVSAHVESTMLVPTHGVPMIVSPADGHFDAVPIIGNIAELVDLVEMPGYGG